MSERRACRIVGQHRSTQRREAMQRRGRRRPEEAGCATSPASTSAGNRKAHGLRRDEGWGCNRNKIQRLWREECLKVPPRTRKRKRRSASTRPADRLSAEHPRHVWALAFQCDETAGILKPVNIVDEHTREELGNLVERRMEADQTVAALEAIMAKEGAAPRFIRSHDNLEVLPTRCATGAASRGRGRATSNRERRGRNPSRIPWFADAVRGAVDRATDSGYIRGSVRWQRATSRTLKPGRGTTLN